MPIYTSYFGNHKNFPEKSCLISIAQYSPIKVDYNLICFAPTDELLSSYKSGKITEEEYTSIYNNYILSNPNAINLLKKFLLSKLEESYENIFLLYFERPENFCHRHLLAKLLDMGIEEFPIYKGSNKT